LSDRGSGTVIGFRRRPRRIDDAMRCSTKCRPTADARTMNWRAEIEMGKTLARAGRAPEI